MFVLLGLTGCELVFDLAEPPDAALDTPAPTTFDEDGDGVLDADDNCPGIANTDQLADADSDLIGDPCDPAPDVTGDRIVVREMFTGGLDVNLVGDVEIADGAAVIDGADTDVLDASIELVAIDTTQRFGLAVEVGFSVFDLGSMANENAFEVQILAETGGARCLLSDDNPSTRTSDALLVVGPAAGIDLAPTPTIQPTFAQRLILSGHEEDGVDCQFDAGRAHSDGTARGEATIRLRIERMRARVNYIVVYDTDREGGQ